MKIPPSLYLALALLPSDSPAGEGNRFYFASAAREDQAGIYTAVLDLESGQLGPVEHIASVPGTGILALHAGGCHLYSTGRDTELDGAKSGTVHAFEIPESGGPLIPLGSMPSGGSHTCYLALDRSGANLLVANYLGGSCAVIPLKPDGSLSPASSVQKHTGSSVHPKRQTAAFTHSINTDPADRFAIVADLGMDKIMSYRFDPKVGTLTPNDPPFIATEAGGGPRHTTFHPSGKFVYANLELSNKVVVYAYDPMLGTLTEVQTLSTLPEGFEGENTTSEILTTPDGRFLYVANRGHNSLAIYSVDTVTGRLTLVGHEPSRGETPRSFWIERTGKYLVATNAKPGNAVVFKIDPQNGRLEFTGSEVSIPNPGCVRSLP